MTTSEDAEFGVTSQVGPWGMVPAWVLLAKDSDGKGLSGADLRVYIALRTFADRERKAFPHVPTIAARAGVNARTAEKCLSRLKEMGLVVSKRRYRADGSIARCDYEMVDIRPVRAIRGAGVPAIWPVPPGEADGTPRRNDRSNNRPLEHPTGTHQGSEQSSPTFVRCAPEAGGATEPEPGSDEEAVTAADITDWRTLDRKLFTDHLGSVVESDGTEYRRGRFYADAFYNEFRRRQGIKWPGRYLDSLNDANDRTGVEDWLLNLGLTRVEAVH
jgi:hypothetical protein